MKELLIAKINEGISERNAIALATRFDSPALDGIQNRLNEMVKELEKLTGEKWVINLDAVERVLATDGMKRLKCKKVCGEWYYIVNKHLAEPYILYGVNGLSAGKFETYADMKSFIDDEGECIKEQYSRPL